MTTLSDLATRVQQATGPSRELDCRVAYALGWRFNGWSSDDAWRPTDEDFAVMDGVAGHWHRPGDVFKNILDKDEYRKGDAEGRWDDPPEWSDSLEWVAALIKELGFAGWDITVHLDGDSHASVWNPSVSATAKTPPLALLSALLLALQEKEMGAS